MEPTQNPLDPKPAVALADSAPAVPAVPAPKLATYDDFAKVEIRAGKILSAEKIPATDKLLKLMVDMGEAEPRQIVSGISMHFPDPAVLVGKTCMFVANLEPRTIKGYVSNGMLFAVSTDTVFSLLEPANGIPPGTKAK